VRNKEGGIHCDRVRQKTSIRRRRRDDEDEQHVEHEPKEAQPHLEVEDEAEPNMEDEVYPRGPVNRSLLGGYENHVAKYDT